MRRLFAALIILPVSACLQIGVPQGDTGGGGSSAGAAGSSSADAGTAAPMGVKCGTDPASGVTLCLGLSSCPSALVDPDQLPGCGYRINGSAIDLECLCNDSLCPVGSAASCDDAKALLRDQTAQGVCAGIAEGRCTTVSQSSQNADSNSAASCDKNCRADCSGDPVCVQLCGC